MSYCPDSAGVNRMRCAGDQPTLSTNTTNVKAKPLMFPKLTAIAANAFTETIRQPLYGVLMWSFMLWLALSPSLAAFSLEAGGDVKIVKGVGVASLLLYGLLASVFAATGVITRELESRTVLTVISKPVSRTTFLLGKYLGVTGAVLIAYYILSLAFILTIRHGVMETVSDNLDGPVWIFGLSAVLISGVVAAFGNYAYGWHFSSTLTYCIAPLGTVAWILVLLLDKEWKPQPITKDFDLPLLMAVMLSFMGTMVLTSFAVTLSTRLSQGATLLLCSMIYVVGLLSNFYIGQHLSAHWIMPVLFNIVPNFQYFWVEDALTEGLLFDPLLVFKVGAYTIAYCLAILSLGVAMFQTREVG